MSQPSPVSSTRRVITVESRERRGSDPTVASKKKEVQKVKKLLYVESLIKINVIKFQMYSCLQVTVTLAIVAKNAELSAKALCHTCGGMFYVLLDTTCR